MKKRNSNTKRKFNFNAIDALIILLIVSLIALTVYFFILGNDFSTPSDEGSTETNTNEEAQATADMIYLEKAQEVYLV